LGSEHFPQAATTTTSESGRMPFDAAGLDGLRSMLCGAVVALVF
jgi:hypothetical protein